MDEHATLRFRIDVSRFVRSMWDAQHSINAMSYRYRGLTPPPKPPYPRRSGRLTAREYRAARRAHRRALTAWTRTIRKETRTR